MSNQLTVGDISIDKMNIECAAGKWSLIPHFEELNIYEDLFENTMTAHLTLQEGINIPSKFPIQGEETVDVSIRLTGVDDTKESILNPPLFHVYNLSDRFIRSPKSQRFSLDLVSEQYMSSLHTKISKSYSDMTADEIVGDIWSNYLDDDKDLYMEETKNSEQVIIPNWHPHQAINWLAKRSQPEDNTATSFLYYETMDGSHFRSLNNMAESEPRITIAKQEITDDPDKIEALSVGLIKADHIIHMNLFDKVQNIKQGQYSSKLLTHDIVKKKIHQHDFNGHADWMWNNHTGTYPLIANSPTELQAGNTYRVSLAPPFNPNSVVTEGRQLSDYTDSHVEFYPKHDKMYAKNAGHEHDNKVEEWKLRRSSHLQVYDSVRMDVYCAGVSFIRLGMTVKLIVPSTEGTSDGKRENAFDKHLTGTYLITSIKHTFTQGESGNFGYKMLLELSKDGLEQMASYRMPRKQGASK